jgi:hypothetical protein
MANMADNSAKLSFVTETSFEDKERIFKKFSEEFHSADFNEEITEEADSYIIYFESKWTAPLKFLEKLVSEEDCIESIIGIASEFSNDYVESYEFPVLKTTFTTK